MENTTLILCADHGQADGIGGHGHLDEGERYVPFFLHGPTIKQGHRIDEKHSSFLWLQRSPIYSAHRFQAIVADLY